MQISLTKTIAAIPAKNVSGNLIAFVYEPGTNLIRLDMDAPTTGVLPVISEATKEQIEILQKMIEEILAEKSDVKDVTVINRK